MPTLLLAAGVTGIYDETGPIKPLTRECAARWLTAAACWHADEPCFRRRCWLNMAAFSAGATAGDGGCAEPSDAAQGAVSIVQDSGVTQCG
ncbi:MAG: hypothetical protein U0694_26975 [Anaerolineae bacterium]